ncbi:hypothetical protein NUH86_01705 [Sphingobium sp. JS3065]|uniref:hypothetical protein n=1 Tax=Sphingobium sp. JS3065 TaxID=2970925 RepID=UPI002263CEB0|nr:hypothetical protein [Sphingobium sp. JS3065]UZW55546.1 hypothetical protein NUH86_01705 [Sphingobium sp. JS3065]
MALSQAELERLQDRLDAYYEAEKAVLRNQSYKMPDGRELTRASLDTIRKAIDGLRNEIANASGAPIVRGRMRRGVIMGQ